MRSLTRVSIIVSFMLALALTACAQTKEQGKPTPEDQQKAMAAMMAAMKPGPEHAGDWTITGKVWMDPNGAPVDMKPGTQHAEMILGGRYLQTVNNGEMMGMPYEGHGLLGYDNFKKQYQMTFVDNMGTTISTATGTADAPDKISLMGKMDDPSTGKKDMDVKYVYTIKDDKTVLFEMFMAQGGKDVKVMEMTSAKK